MIAMLGDLLFADRSNPRVPENQWVELVHSIARRDQFAMRALYERTHRLVFTLLVRMTRDSAVAADTTIDSFCDVWRCAPRFHLSDETVVGWVMNLARRRAIDRLREHREDRPRESQERRVGQAVARLNWDARTAIETAFFSDSTYVEVGAALDRPLDTVRRQIRSGMAQLARDLAEEDAQPTSPAPSNAACAQAEWISLYALRALPPGEMFLAATHIGACIDCRQEIKALQRVTDSFAFWPTDVLRPSANLWGRLSKRIVEEDRGQIELAARRHRPELAWEQVAPGIFCKLLATDAEKHRVSMLVRLASGVEYPPHRHARVDELHLLDGELWIDRNKLHPGDYNRAERRASDARVRSDTGCTCVLITSPLDELGTSSRAKRRISASAG